MLILISTITISIILVYLRYIKFDKNASSSSINRLRKKLTGRAHINQRIFERYAEHLGSNPYQNINLAEWNDEGEIREKADIHKARLNKYGKSKLNGKIFYLDKKGSVYNITEEGDKDYV